MEVLHLENDNAWVQFCSFENNPAAKSIHISTLPPTRVREDALRKLSQTIKFSTHLLHIDLEAGPHRNDLPRCLVSTVCESVLQSTAKQKLLVRVVFPMHVLTSYYQILPISGLMKRCEREMDLCVYAYELNEDDDSYSLLADALRHLSGTITKLICHANLGDDNVCALSENLKLNDTLTTLSLPGNSIGNDGAQALAEALKYNGALTTLDLWNNVIGDDGAVALAEAIACNSTLDSLYLTSNFMTKEVGISALENGLNHNPTLTVLGLDMDHTSGINFALRRNKALRKESSWMKRFSNQHVRLKGKLLSRVMERYSMSEFSDLTFLFLRSQASTIAEHDALAAANTPTGPTPAHLTNYSGI